MTTRNALTRNARHAILSAEKMVFNTYLTVTWAANEAVTAELLRHRLIQEPYKALDAPASGRYYLTDAGHTLRGKLEHRNRISHLADEIRKADLSGEDVTDIAASIDAGETEFVGDQFVWLAMGLVASLAESSAEDIRQEVEIALGWHD